MNPRRSAQEPVCPISKSARRSPATNSGRDRASPGERRALAAPGCAPASGLVPGGARAASPRARCAAVEASRGNRSCVAVQAKSGLESRAMRTGKPVSAHSRESGKPDRWAERRLDPRFALRMHISSNRWAADEAVSMVRFPLLRVGEGGRELLPSGRWGLFSLAPHPSLAFAGPPPLQCMGG